MKELKVGVLLLLMEVMDVGCTTLSKAAMAKGMSSYVFITYTHGLALFFLLPSAFISHRKMGAPHIGIPIIMRLCLLGILCCGCSMFLFIGIRYSSPTLASAMNNLSPAVTFMLAILFRMESLNMRAQSSLLKLIGTLVSICGAFVVTFYQGMPIIKLWSSSSSSSSTLLMMPSLDQTNYNIDDDQPSWGVGAVLLAFSSIFLSLQYTVKTWVAREMESEVLITVISFFFETSAAALITAIAEKDNPSVWFPTVEISVIAILYGALEVGVVNTVQTWACGKNGPLFVAMFKPLQMIIAVFMGVSFLKDTLHIGSVIGGTIIAVGFYTVMKGKADEAKMGKQDNNMMFYSSQSSSDDCINVPLLQNKNMQV